MTQHAKISSIQQEKRFTSQLGMELQVETIPKGNHVIYKVSNPNISIEQCMLYLHGGPNLSCEPYIEDTIHGGYRSLEPFLLHTNIILVDVSTSSSDYDIKKSEGKSTNQSSILEILSRFKPESLATVYLSAVSEHLINKRGSVYAQSFGAQILFHLLPELDKINFDAKQIYLGSPFLGVKNTNDFVEHRRKSLFHRFNMLAKLIQTNDFVISIRNRIDSLGMPELVWHKLALNLTHPAHPPGLVAKNLLNKFEEITLLDDTEFRDYFSTSQHDIINFIVGSASFTPGSNIYIATGEHVKAFPLSDDLPDEAIWLLYNWETEYGSSPLLSWKSTSVNYHNTIDFLQHLSETLKIYLIFDPTDFMIPVNSIAEEFMPVLENKIEFHTRENYGHWAGHSVYSRINGKI